MDACRQQSSLKHRLETSELSVAKRAKVAPSPSFANNATMMALSSANARNRPRFADGRLVDPPQRFPVKGLCPADPKVEEGVFRQLFDQVQRNTARIAHGEAPDVALHVLLLDVERLCNAGLGHNLYNQLLVQWKQSLPANELESVANASRDVDKIAMLTLLVSRWDQWRDRVAAMRLVCAFLDRICALEVTTLEKPALGVFKTLLSLPAGQQQQQQLQLQHQHQQQPTAALNTAISAANLVMETARKDKSHSDLGLLKSFVSMLTQLQLYTQPFEAALISSSVDSYTKLGQTMADTLELPSHIEACHEFLEQERERCVEIGLDTSTRVTLLDHATALLVAKHIDKLVDAKSVADLVRRCNVEVLGKLYGLLTRDPKVRDESLKKLQEPWSKYIVDAGSEFVRNAVKADMMIVDLLLLRRDLDVLVRQAFANNEDFAKCLKDAFVRFVNDRQLNSSWGTKTSKVGEMIAKYMDMLLRGGFKAIPPKLLSRAGGKLSTDQAAHSTAGESQDEELDRQLENALQLVRFINGRDVFEAFYKRDLAKRLLLNRSANYDVELNMMNKFNEEFGSTFASKLYTMFNDREASQKVMDAYRKHFSTNDASADQHVADLDMLNVFVLNHSAWPSYAAAECRLPPLVHKHVERFNTYYLANSGANRKLIWLHNLSHAVLTAHFRQGRKELVVSAFQAMVLLLFNEQSQWSAAAIQEQLGIKSSDELYPVLLSLSLGKSRVLRSVPLGTKNIEPATVFVVNDSFTDPRYRIKINMIQMKETGEENKEVHERVEADRDLETQAAIVRTMKSKQTLSHVDLVQIVMEMMSKRGQVDVSSIKKTINKLIEKEYLARTDEGGYRYL